MTSDVNDNEKLLAEIEARANAATTGPWYRSYNWVDVPGPDEESTSAEWAKALICTAGAVHDRREPHRIKDAEFIAHAREDVPWLVDQLRTVLAERDEARASADAYSSHLGALHEQAILNEKRLQQRIDNVKKWQRGVMAEPVSDNSTVSYGAWVRKALTHLAVILTATETSEQP